MITNRRKFILAGTAAWAMTAGCGFAQTSGRVLAPEQFGARGDGRTDDTQALQICLEAAGRGDVVRLRRGAVYRIDTNRNPTRDEFGGLKLKPGQMLELNGAELRALPTRAVGGCVIQGFHTSGWQIKGPGRIVGERSGHLGTGGEWGMGIAAFSCTGWRITGGVEISGCWGDGLYVGNGRDATFNSDFLVSDIKIFDCRRNGISVVAGRGGEITRADIRDINGTAPRGAIDLEPDHKANPNRDLKITNSKLYGDIAVGLYVTSANERITASNLQIDAANSGIIVADDLAGLTVTGCRINSRDGGAEGAAIRTVGNTRKIAGLHIRDNLLTGGGYFVVDIFGDGFRDVVVAGNRIEAGPKVQGIARVHYSSFTDNICTIGARAGKLGDYFLHLVGSSHGRNSFRNLSPHPMYAAIINGRDLGGDVYSGANLRVHKERA
jgi:hypothetical protein